MSVGVVVVECVLRRSRRSMGPSGESECGLDVLTAAGEVDGGLQMVILC